VPDPAPIELTSGTHLLRLTEMGARSVGARLCYGEPVQHASRTVIPVSSMWGAGGFGFGDQPGAKQQGGAGGGGILESHPVGFIEIADGEARFRRIITATEVAQAVGSLAAAVALITRARRRRRH
jgi:uncharacterized spore protein YtfJ